MENLDNWGELQTPSELLFSVTKGKEKCLDNNPPGQFCCTGEDCTTDNYPPGVLNGRKFGFEMTYGNWPRRKDLYSVQDCQNIADCDTLCMNSGPTTTWQNCQYCQPKNWGRSQFG